MSYQERIRFVAQLDNQLAEGREAEKLLQAIALDVAGTEQQLNMNARPSKRLKTVEGVSRSAPQGLVSRVRRLLHILLKAESTPDKVMSYLEVQITSSIPFIGSAFDYGSILKLLLP